MKELLKGLGVSAIAGFALGGLWLGYGNMSDGKKPKDDLEIILLYEDKHNKGKVTTVGLSERFFNQCDLIE